MYDYYCKNCNNKIGKWDNEYKYYHVLPYYCNFITSKNIASIFFLDCKNCNKFVGLLCTDICKNCFGKNEIYEEEKLFNWFLKYKKIIKKNFKFNYDCKICNKNDNRAQLWFFEELTFYK